MLKSDCNNNNIKKKMQLPGREPSFFGLIGHHQNHYATTPMQILNKIFTYI